MKKLLLIGLLSIATLSYARILHVPDSLGTIRLAIDSSLAGDTILLSQGIYLDTVSVSHALTISSNFMFSGDSVDINQTRWRAIYGRSLLQISNTSLQFIGLNFISEDSSVLSRNVILSESSQISLWNCRFKGTFAQVVYPNDATINLTGTSSLFARYCGVSGDENGSLWIRSENTCRYIRINQSWFVSQGVRSSIAPLIYLVADTVRFDSCTFSGRSRIMWIAPRQFEVTNCIMEGFNADALRLVGGNLTVQSKFTGNVMRNSFITDQNSCVFSIPGLNATANTHLIENCTFENITQAPDVQHAELVYASNINPVIFRKCNFINNEIHTNPMIVLSPYSVIDSCRFIGNNVAYLLSRSSSSWPINFRDCDFVNNSGFINFDRIDSVLAPNCYWGSVTGPQCALNPTGTGQWVVPYLNPIPFRTTPVFPDTRAPEESPRSEQIPTNSILLECYPNPANPDVTIRATLPDAIRDVEVTIVNLTGQTVATLHHGPLAGQREWQWQPVSASSGVYFARITPLHSNLTPTSQKFVVLK